MSRYREKSVVGIDTNKLSTETILNQIFTKQFSLSIKQ